MQDIFLSRFKIQIRGFGRKFNFSSEIKNIYNNYIHLRIKLNKNK